MRKTLVSAQITKVETRSEPNCYKITTVTQEVSPRDGAHLMGLAHKQVWQLFAEYDKDTPDEEFVVPDEKPASEYGEKTPSQRMRAVLYKIWEQDGKPGKSFELYYRVRAERIVQKLKEELS